MEKLFEDSVLEDLFKIRTDGVEYLYEKNNENSVNFKSKIEGALCEIIKDDNKIKNIIEKFEELLFDELNYWNFAYYKIGVIDGIKVLQEVKEESKYWKK